MIYQILNNDKIVSTQYNIPQVSNYLREQMPNVRGLGERTVKQKINANGFFEKGTYRVNRVENTEAIRRRTIPRNLRNLRIVRDNDILTRLKFTKSRFINMDNVHDFVKLITELIKQKGEDFLLSHKISIVLISKKYDDEEITMGTRFLDFNSLYRRLIDMITEYYQEYDADFLNVQNIMLYYIQKPDLNDVYIYKGNEDLENNVMDDIMNRMIIEDKKSLLKMLNKYYIWSPSTNKNCCIQACFMAKYKKRDIKDHTKIFVKKYNKDDKLVYNLETLCPLLKQYLKVNIKATCIDTKIKEYEYEYQKDANTINILVKGGHTYALIPKKDFEDEEEHNDELDNQILIEKPDYDCKISDYNIATFDLETCDTEETKQDKNNTTVYALGYYNGNEYKEIYKTEEDKDKNVLSKFLEYLYNKEQGKKIIYAHNGGKFDTYLLLKEVLKGNLFTVTSYLDSNGRILNMTIVENYKWDGKHKRKPKEYIFRDSLNLISGSLDNACKSFNPKTKKLTGDVDHNKININNCYTKKIYDYTKEYLKNDCVSLYEILTMFSKTINKAYKFHINEVMTNASIARRVFLTKHDHEKYPLYTLDRDTDRQLRKYYFGGRNECMTKLGYHKGKFYYVDFTSLYPYVMAIYEFFYGKMEKIVLKENAKFNNEWFGFVKVQFRHKKKDEIPLHAIVKDGKLVFPYVDNWTEAIISTEEIKYSIENKLGYEYKYIEVFNWKKKSNYFKPIIDELYKMKIDAQKDGNKALRQTGKIIINSTYGFFGINFLERSQTKIINERCSKKNATDEQKKELINNKRMCRFYGYLFDQKLKDHQEAGKYDIYQIEDVIKCKCANVGIASMVTSYARMELYKLLKAIKDKGGNIYYMDTDSVITDYNIYDDNSFNSFIGSGGDKLGELTNEALDQYIAEIKDLYMDKIKNENPELKSKKYGWDKEKLSEIYNVKYKKKVNKYIQKTYKMSDKDFNNKKKKTPHYTELITTGNKMYALNTRFKYDFEGDEKILKTGIMKMKGVNSKQKYNKKYIDHKKKIIHYSDINNHSGKEKICFDDYKLMAYPNNYKILCDNMNFITGAKEMLIKDNGLIKINNTKQVKALYDKGVLDKDNNITPLII